MSHSIHRRLMHLYDADKQTAEERMRERLAAAETAIPALAAVEQALKEKTIAISRRILAGGGDVSALRAEMDALRESKRALLNKAGIDPGELTEAYTCKTCRDTGYTAGLEGRMVKCPCMKQKLVDLLHKEGHLTDTFFRENFDTFDLRCYSGERWENELLSPYENMKDIVLATCQSFVEDFGQGFENLLFCGDTGLGKTFLCNCIAGALLQSGKSVLYVTAPRFFKKIEDYRFNREEMDAPDEQMAMVYDVDALIIDDLGSEFATIVTNTALFELINSRILDRRATVISTNLSERNFQQQYSDRIVSRLFGHYKILRFYGEDIRQKKKFMRLGKEV